MDGFSCRSHRNKNSVFVVVEGELDILTARILQTELALALAQATTLVIDCAGIAFIDSAGLRPLEWAARRCAESETGLVLRRMPRSMARIVRLLGLEGTFGQPGPAPERATADDPRHTPHRSHPVGRVTRQPETAGNSRHVESYAARRAANCRYSR